MSIIQILKEDYLFEDEYNPYSIQTEDELPQGEFPKDDGRELISKDFAVKLTNYLDKKLDLEFGTFDTAVCNEIRKYMDESDNKVVKKVKEKIHKIIVKEKHDFLKRVQNKMERLRVPKKTV